MLVRDAMCRFPIIVSPGLACREALEISHTSEAHFLLVVDGEQLVGVARACDLRKALAEREVWRSLRVPIVTVGLDDSLVLARRMLTQCAGGCLVVVDRSGDLKGILTCEDLNRAHGFARPSSRACCETCGSAQHLIFGQPDEAIFCCGCVEQARAQAQITLTAS